MSKNQLKNFLEKMPRVKDLAPVKESPTIFEAFLSKEKQEENVASKNPSKQESNTANGHVSKKNPNKKKNQQDKKKETEKPRKSLEESLNSINIDEFQSFVSLVQQRFPETPLVWLKDIVTFLNVKLNVSVTDPLFSGKPVDYPLSVMPARIHDIILEVLDKCPTVVLQLYFEMLITNFVEDMIKGHDVNGYRIFVQIMAFSKPTLALNNMQKYKDLQSQHQNRHPVCLSLLWALGQCGVKDLACGIKIWLEIMLPVIGLRAYSKYTIDYLDVLFSMHSDVQPCSQILNIREFFPILDLVFSHSANLPVALHKQLLGLYPKIKTVAFGPNCEQVLRNYFPLFLIRLVPDSPVLLQNELKTCLTMCLATDVHCYSIWRQLYTKNLFQSSLLLQHLLDEWESVGSGLPKKLLRETLGTFRVTNEELESSSKNPPKGFQDCFRTCDALLKKTSVASMFPWRLFSALVFITFGGLFAYDVTTHGTFQASKTGQLLNDIGAIAVCNQAWLKIELYSLKVYRWMEENLPVYLAYFWAFLNPYIQSFWSQLYLFGAYLVDQTEDVRNYLSREIPKFLEWIEGKIPFLTEKILEGSRNIWAHVERLVPIVWSPVVQGIQTFGTWLQENVFIGELSFENLEKRLVSLTDTMSGTLFAAYEWLTQQAWEYTAALRNFNEEES